MKPLERMSVTLMATMLTTVSACDRANESALPLSDLAVFSADYMNLFSVLTVLGGNVVHGDGPFSTLAPPLPPPSPEWSPVNRFGGYYTR
jgi:hypothetical protein